MQVSAIAIGFVVLALTGRLAEAMLEAGHGVAVILAVGLVAGAAAYRLMVGRVAR